MDWDTALIPIASLLLGYLLRYLAEYLQQNRATKATADARRREAQRTLLLEFIGLVGELEATTEALVLPAVREINANRIWKGVDEFAEETRAHMAVRRRTMALAEAIEDDEVREKAIEYLKASMGLLGVESGKPPDAVRSQIKTASEAHQTQYTSLISRIGDRLRNEY